MNYFLFTIAALFFLTQNLPAQSAAPFAAGEKLTYNISFATFTDAGYLELHTIGREKLDDQREAFAVRGKLRTNGIVKATLLDLDYDFTTFVAPENNFPVRVERFDRANGKTLDIRRDFAENAAATPNLNGVYDLVSAVYALRAADFGNAAPNALKVWENDQIYEANAQFVGRETVSTTVGAFKTGVLNIRSENDFIERLRARVHLSDDERRIPVLITLKHPRGEIRVELVSIQNTIPEVVAVATPTPVPTPAANPTPRPPAPRPTPKPYVDNVPLDADLPFALGEKLQFELKRQNQKIGVMLLEVADRKQFAGRDGVRLSARFLEGGAPADKIESIIDPNSLTPFRSETRMTGAILNLNQTLSFDQERGAVTTGTGVRVEVPVGTYDFLSFLYALRAFRFAEVRNASDTRAAIFINDKFVVATLKPTREIIEVGGKKVRAIALTMTTGDPQIDSLNLRLWLSDDFTRYPLRLNFNSPSGAIQADLLIR